jgi:hypothetical protein
MAGSLSVDAESLPEVRSGSNQTFIGAWYDFLKETTLLVSDLLNLEISSRSINEWPAGNLYKKGS